MDEDFIDDTEWEQAVAAEPSQSEWGQELTDADFNAVAAEPNDEAAGPSHVMDMDLSEWEMSQSQDVTEGPDTEGEQAVAGPSHMAAGPSHKSKFNLRLSGPYKRYPEHWVGKWAKIGTQIIDNPAVRKLLCESCFLKMTDQEFCYCIEGKQIKI